MVVRALGIGEGDEVITTPFSFVASANCLLYERADPALRRHRGGQPGLDPDLVEPAAGPRTQGHPAGPRVRPAVPDRARSRRSPNATAGRSSRTPARRSARARRPSAWLVRGRLGLRLLPEQADHHRRGRGRRDRRSGLAATFRSLRNQGRDEDGTWLSHVRLGYNYRLDEMSAAIGVAQLERLDELAAGRARVVAAYEAAFGGARLAASPEQPAADETVDWFVYVVRLDPRIDRDAVIADLDAARSPEPTVLQPAPPAAVLPRVRPQAGRLPGHRAGRGLHPRAAVLGGPVG